jgi:hypothetical protein
MKTRLQASSSSSSAISDGQVSSRQAAGLALGDQAGTDKDEMLTQVERKISGHQPKQS